MKTPIIKTVFLFTLILSIISITFAFTVFHYEEGDSRVAYSLINQDEQLVNQNDFAGRFQLVFFGFTSCKAVCPLQMNKLTNVMSQLESNGYGDQVTPIFITVDPERDSPEKLRDFLGFFHEKFVGLTGSRSALKITADSFKTLLSNIPEDPEANYQITHSSVVYLLDPYNRIVDFIPFAEGTEGMSERIQRYL